MEAEGGVCGAALVVHADEGRDEDVDVVVDFDAGFGVGGPQDPSDVLDDAAFEADREREEQCVEGWAVEPFAEQTGRRGEKQSVAGCGLGELVGHGLAGFGAHLAVQDEGREFVSR